MEVKSQIFLKLPTSSDNVDLDVRGGDGCLAHDTCPDPDDDTCSYNEKIPRCGDTCCHVYCATLAHKACHSFTPNATFEDIWHPRCVWITIGNSAVIYKTLQVWSHHELGR